MQSQTENPCIRCGKLRIIDKVWKEYLGNSLIINTRTICPDADCQRIVDEDIAVRREKRELHANRHGSFSKRDLKLNPKKESIS